MLHRCIHTPYHCRFLTERPIFHPRRFFFLPIGQSVSIFNAVPPSEPCTGLPAAWKRSGTTVHARPPTAHAPPIRLISIRVGTLGEASQFLPVFARVTIDRRPSLRDLVSHDLHGEINDPYVRENRLSLTGLNRAWLLLFFFYFWWSAVYPLCFAPIQSSWKGRRKCRYEKIRILAFSFLSFGFDEDDERFNDPRWNFTRLLGQTTFFYLNLVEQLWWKSRLRSLGGFRYLSKRAPLHPTRTISLCPRVVSHDTRGKSHKKRNQRWLLLIC